MQKGIYLDHAATTPLSERVFETMKPYFLESYGNADSPHAKGREASAAVDRARDILASALQVKAKEVYFTSGGTEADNWALLGGARAAKKKGKTHILLSPLEHHAVLYAAETLGGEGFEVEYLSVDERGFVRVEEVAKKLRKETALVCVMAVNNETGVRQPIEKIGELLDGTETLFFVDAVQAFPHERVAPNEWKADLVAVSAHKLGGPKGIGALYVKSGVKLARLIGGGEQERGLRGGTLNVPAIVGFGEAVKRNEAGRDEANAKITALSRRFLEKIFTVGGVSVNGSEKERTPAILNLRIEGVSNATLLYKTDLAGLRIAAGSACSSASVKPSHVLTAMGLSEREAKECIRVSFGVTNTIEEIDEAAAILKRAIEELRK